jgi:hypothetical protein
VLLTFLHCTTASQLRGVRRKEDLPSQRDFLNESVRRQNLGHGNVSVPRETVCKPQQLQDIPFHVKMFGLGMHAPTRISSVSHRMSHRRIWGFVSEGLPDSESR